jgi:hypothetical protein
MPSRQCNVMGSPGECAAAQSLITPALLAQAEEIRVNWWDYHPHACLPADRSLVAYSDGIWIVEAGAVLNRLVRFARVADSWPVSLDFGGLRITSNGRGELPISGSCAHESLRLVVEPGAVPIAEVPAPAGGWDHASLAAALSAQHQAIVSAPAVRAMLGGECLGTTSA